MIRIPSRARRSFDQVEVSGLLVAACALFSCENAGNTRTSGPAADAGSGGSHAAGSANGGGGGASENGGNASGGRSASGGGTGTGGSPSLGDGSTKDCGGIRIPMGKGSPSGGKIGTWEDVTPAGISMKLSDFNGDNYGAQDVLVDPVRPSDLYAFFCHQGVFKSTDYGVSWTKVNKGANGDKIDSGKPWGEAIETDLCRDPSTPPTLYSAGSQGRFWRSRNGGVDWEGFDLPENGKPRPQDGYDVDVDPYDKDHLVFGFHEEAGVAESTDGGEHWRAVPVPSGMQSGVSWYVFFIDTGQPATTRNTWLAIAQATGGNDGTWRTADGGTSWKKVESNEHGHGQAQLFQTAGVVYMAGVYGTQGWGIYRSTDFAATWTHLGPGSGQNGVYGTAKYVYVQSGGANASGIDQAQSQRAPLPPGTEFTTWPVPVGNGPKHAAVTYDGTHYIVVTGNWLSGLNRYVEP